MRGVKCPAGTSRRAGSVPTEPFIYRAFSRGLFAELATPDFEYQLGLVRTMPSTDTRHAVAARLLLVARSETSHLRGSHEWTR
jgi:hypothetical protein